MSVQYSVHFAAVQVHLTNFDPGLDDQPLRAKFAAAVLDVVEKRIGIVLVIADVLWLVVEMLRKRDLQDILANGGAAHFGHAHAAVTAIVAVHVIVVWNLRHREPQFGCWYQAWFRRAEARDGLL